MDFSRSKDNQTRTFGQLIEYNMRYIFLEKLYSKCDIETSPKPFHISKHNSGSITLDQQSEVLQSLILLYIQVEDYQNILKLKF